MAVFFRKMVDSGGVNRVEEDQIGVSVALFISFENCRKQREAMKALVIDARISWVSSFEKF